MVSMGAFTSNGLVEVRADPESNLNRFGRYGHWQDVATRDLVAERGLAASAILPPATHCPGTLLWGGGGVRRADPLCRLLQEYVRGSEQSPLSRSFWLSPARPALLCLLRAGHGLSLSCS